LGLKVASASYPDPTQFEKKGEYFDPKATEEKRKRPKFILLALRRWRKSILTA